LNKTCIVIKNDGIGDLVLASGIISRLHEIYNEGVDLVTCEENREIAAKIPNLRNIFYISRDQLKVRPQFYVNLKKYVASGPKSDIKVLKEISKNNYDDAFCLRRFIRTSSFAVMLSCSAKRKFCCWEYITNTSKAVAGKCSKQWIKIDIPRRILSEASYYKKFIELAIGHNINCAPRLSDIDENISKLPKSVAIGIGGASSRWSIDKWVRVIESLLDNGFENIAIFGGENSGYEAELLTRIYPKVSNFVGSDGLDVTLETLKRFSIYIGNDTGLSHLASLYIKKCFIVLGGGTFKRFFPWPQTNNQYVLFYGLDCFDCDWRCQYSSKLCLNILNEDDLLKYIDDVLSLKTFDHMRNLNQLEKEYTLAWRRSNLNYTNKF
jgi:ADP-heptose:LPS heptosyltransferase